MHAFTLSHAKFGSDRRTGGVVWESIPSISGTDQGEIWRETLEDYVTRLQ